jgi:transposase
MTRKDLIIENTQLKVENRWLKEQLLLSKKKQFGSSSEKMSALQIEFGFNEAETVADTTGEVVEPKTITYVRKPKSQGHREEVLANIPTEIVEHKLPEDQQICSCCGGHLHEMSTQSRDEIVIIPAQVKATKHVTFIYGCRHCEKNEISVPIIKASAPKPLIKGSLASASAVAYVMSQKFVEAMPLYRQEKHFERLGIELPRANLSNWMLKGGEMIEPIYNRMHEKLLELDILHADETSLQVIREDGRDAKTKSFMWLYRSGRYSPPIVLYEYQRTRDGDHPMRFLPDFAGYLHADAYAGYNDVKKATLIGCWAHARRKFVEAFNTLPKEAQSNENSLANIALKYISKLYKIEKELHDASSEHRKTVRNLRSKEILDEFKTWLGIESRLTVPKSTIGKAITYCLNQWTKLTAFLDDGRLEIDNNRAERSIKPFVIGRKNWLFANTPRGAKTSAIIYSIVETAKENGLDPFAYLEYIFERINNIDPANSDAIDSLLPWNEVVQAAIKISLNTASS